MTDFSANPHSRRGAALLLGLGTLVLFARTVGFSFCIIDDPLCVQIVPQITKGISWEGLIWAFKDGVTDAHWKPLTVLSHMLDCELYGLQPGGHHATNVLLHTASALILFATLHRMTGALWRSWVVAAVFAWHPLHVESVAWITERKDVLYGFFWMLAMWAYVRYVESPSVRRYAVVVAACAASFLSKSMAATLPFVLLLLDVWPLQRLRLPWLKNGDLANRVPCISWSRALIEKLPLILLAFATVAVASRVLRNADALGAHMETTPALRNANALVSYIRYVVLTVWPEGLAVFYPLPRSIPVWQWATATAAILGFTAFAVAHTKRRPWLLIGWLWFAGAVTPVIGFVQPSWAAYADRYTYIPQIGLVLMLVWTAAELASRFALKKATAALTVACLAASVAVSWRQIGFWRDNLSLARRALSVTSDNWFIHHLLAELLVTSRNLEEAESHLKEALRLRDDVAGIWSTYARLLILRGKHAEARALFRNLFGRMTGPAAGQRDRYLRRFEDEARTFPQDPDTQYALANAFEACGRHADAVAALERVLALRTNYVSARVDLGALLAGQGKVDIAIGHYRTALAEEPANALAHANLGGLLSDQGNLDEALVHLHEAHRLQPGNSATHYNLALALAKRGRHAESVPHLRAVLQAQPQHANAINRLAWHLATSADDALRNGSEALVLAGRLQELTGRSQAMAFDTEAAALAECGRFEDAVAAARRGLELATAAKAEPLATSLAARLKLYEARSPVREGAKSNR